MECQSRWSGVASGVGIFCFFCFRSVVVRAGKRGDDLGRTAGRRASAVAVSVGLVQRDLVAVEAQYLRGFVVLLVAVRALHGVVREGHRAPHRH